MIVSINMTDYSTQITSAVNGHKKVTSDGVTVESHPLKDLIEADRYVSAKAAGYKSIRLSRMINPGAID